MNKIKIFSHSIQEIGYVARTNTKGNEFDMVNRYIEHIIKKYSKLKRKQIAIFIEPQIDTGYPDIVIVEYNTSSEHLWNENRKHLSTNDLKILYQIQQQKNASLKSLNELLGFSIIDIKKSITRLATCNLVHLSKTQNHVRNIQLSAYCRINKIISIEAKIDKWSEAIQQASKNVWFSTESYILMNKDSCNNLIIEKCKQHGIGIILVNGRIQYELESEHRVFPVSYASLQFNEWIQRASHCKEDNL